MHSYIVTVIAVSVLCVGCDRDASGPMPESTKTGIVTVKIDIDEKTRSFEVRDVSAGATVEAVMREFDGVPIKITGTGTTAFVHSIDAVATSAAEGWTYRVDGEFANSGIGTTELTPPATIHWRFGSWEK